LLVALLIATTIVVITALEIWKSCTASSATGIKGHELSPRFPKNRRDALKSESPKLPVKLVVYFFIFQTASKVFKLLIVGFVGSCDVGESPRRQATHRALDGRSLEVLFFSLSQNIV